MSSARVSRDATVRTFARLVRDAMFGSGWAYGRRRTVSSEVIYICLLAHIMCVLVPVMICPPSGCKYFYRTFSVVMVGRDGEA